MKLYDLSHPLSAATPPWPGDTPFGLAPTARLAAGDSVNLSSFTMSPHVGTHADAPYHYDNQGPGIDQVPVERYIGPARVVALEGRTIIDEADLRGLSLSGVERLLVRTGSCPDSTRFHDSFTAFTAAAIRYMAAQGVRLLGTDAHSVDPSESKTLDAHHACGAAGILILENLNLAAVPEGAYELIALPLKLVGADGSPVRAVLRAL